MGSKVQDQFSPPLAKRASVFSSENKQREGGREGCFPGRDTWELLSQVPALRGGGGWQGGHRQSPHLGESLPTLPARLLHKPLGASAALFPLPAASEGSLDHHREDACHRSRDTCQMPFPYKHPHHDLC